jgi:hypothetical protein
MQLFPRGGGDPRSPGWYGLPSIVLYRSEICSLRNARDISGDQGRSSGQGVGSLVTGEFFYPVERC